MKPIDKINELKKHYLNTDINWEMILELGYRLFLGSRSVVIDVGGHAGRHTDVFVHELGCKRVMVFEPLPAQCDALRERYRGCPQVELFGCALGKQAGTSDFVFNWNSPEESGLRERYYADPEGKKLEILQVEVAALDEMNLALEGLDYVKIDTEGGETDIILGAANALRRHRPILSVEYGAAGYQVYGYTRSTLFDLATDLDYGLFDLFGHALSTPEDWDECADNYYWDFYMVPKERGEAFSQLLLGAGLFESVPQYLTRPISV